MTRILISLCLPLLLSGCYRDYAPTQPLPVMHVGRKIIVNALAGSTETSVNWRGLRIGGYYDFSSYDSLVVTFNALRVQGSAATIPLGIKIGPAFYAYVDLARPVQSFRYTVVVPLIAKPQFAALTFLVRDTVSSIMLSDVVVVGWYTY